MRASVFFGQDYPQEKFAFTTLHRLLDAASQRSGKVTD
jgi:hypothetical protein